MPSDEREWLIWCSGQDTWRRLIKPVAETQNTNTTMTDDDTLVFTVKAYQIIVARYTVIYNTTTNAGFKCGINGPSTPTKLRYRLTYNNPGGTNVDSASITTFGSSTSIGTTSNSMAVVHIDLICSNGANNGAIAFQWAQATSHADDTTVHEGAYVEWVIL